MGIIFMQDVFFILLLVACAWLSGMYMYRVYIREAAWTQRFLGPAERFLYRVTGTVDAGEMSAKEYVLSLGLFSICGFVFVLLICLLQGFLPGNPAHFCAIKPDLAFNIAASFVSNTNWQAYNGEEILSNLTQMLALAVQNFVSAAAGIAVLFALMRGLANTEMKKLGNFWHDMIRITLYILLPLSLILAVVLVSQGVVQTFSGTAVVATHSIPLGPAASQIAIKQLGTNGGGFFGANSAFPFENPTALANLLELLAILVLPAGLCFTFGRAMKDSRQGTLFFVIMLAVFVLCLAFVTYGEYATHSMEGKEVRFGIGSSALWATATTAASNGSVNSMLDSFSPLSGFVLMFLMQVGEVIFGGVGSGLYTMIAFCLMTVFIAGLMIGRTPEFMRKKLDPFDMKMVCVIILVPPMTALAGSALATLVPEIVSGLANSGPHGFSEILYAFTSMGNNNGSAFGGYPANTLFTNIAGGLIMLVARFAPIVACLYLAENLARKKVYAVSEGTLRTNDLLFAVLLVGIIILVGALSFLPALALGPIADSVSSVL